MGADRRAFLLIVASRSLSEAVALTAVAALLHATTLGRDPLPMIETAVAVFGITLVLGAVLRERGTVRQSAALVAVVMAAWAAWGLSQPARSPDAVAVLTRLVGFGILGEIHVWRVLGIARGLQRWREVRNDALFALAGIVVVALVAGPIDRDALPALALAVVCGGAVALSLARSSEELALTTGQVHGRQTGSSATGTAFALGVLAIALAFLLPSLQVLVGRVAGVAGPLLSDILFLILLPLGYLAAYLVNVALWIRERLRMAPPRTEEREPVDLAVEAARLRELEELRPYVFGALEILVAVVALLVAVLLIVRLATERRALLAEGVSLEREHVEGIGLDDTLRRLFAPGRAQRRPPADDGTPAATIRRLYWRVLDLAEREGPGWRAPSETPAEHEARLTQAAPKWRDASPVVRAFEALRYGDVDPDQRTVEGAREALRRVEAVR
ncbi:MAG: DUF4129 domain-containing protein [Chloroflexi bacterium]|nr:DUF4129 domain-containing protein [Chloroflexota bacterium]